MSLMQELVGKALDLRVPLSAHLDITYRCNEQCEHCYLDHEDHGEMSTAEIKNLLRQLADAQVFFLTLSGGEALMRRDCFEIIEYARSLMFNVKLKTNAVLIPRRKRRGCAPLASNRCRSASTRTGPKCTTRSRRFPVRSNERWPRFDCCDRTACG